MEIVNCRGKDSIPLFWRLFKAYGFGCYCIFDGRTKQDAKLFAGIIDDEVWIVDADKYVVKYGCAYFGKNFESYFRAVMLDYAEKEQEATE